MATAPAQRSDRDLLEAVRSGDSDAYGDLYARYSTRATAYARRIVRSPDDAADVVSEAFVKIFSLLGRDRGPRQDFAPYLTRAVRNIAYDRLRAGTFLRPTDDVSVLEQSRDVVDPVDETMDRALARSAFLGLPERWRHVLSLVCIQEAGCDEAAAALGLSRTALTSLACRAREGLRQSYLMAHLQNSSNPTCARHRVRMAAVVRSTAAPAAQRQVHQHLLACRGCRHDYAEMQTINSTLQIGTGELAAQDLQQAA